MAELTWMDRYEKMEERQRNQFDRIDALLEALLQHSSKSSTHGVLNSFKEPLRKPFQSNFMSPMAESSREFNQRMAAKKLKKFRQSCTRITYLLQEEIDDNEALPSSTEQIPCAEGTHTLVKPTKNRTPTDSQPWSTTSLAENEVLLISKEIAPSMAPIRNHVAIDEDSIGRLANTDLRLGIYEVPLEKEVSVTPSELEVMTKTVISLSCKVALSLLDLKSHVKKIGDILSMTLPHTIFVIPLPSLIIMKSSSIVKPMLPKPPYLTWGVVANPPPLPEPPDGVVVSKFPLVQHLPEPSCYSLFVLLKGIYYLLLNIGIYNQAQFSTCDPCAELSLDYYSSNLDAYLACENIDLGNIICENIPIHYHPHKAFISSVDDIDVLPGLISHLIEKVGVAIWHNETTSIMLWHDTSSSALSLHINKQIQHHLQELANSIETNGQIVALEFFILLAAYELSLFCISSVLGYRTYESQDLVKTKSSLGAQCVFVELSLNNRLIFVRECNLDVTILSVSQQGECLHICHIIIRIESYNGILTWKHLQHHMAPTVLKVWLELFVNSIFPAYCYGNCVVSWVFPSTRNWMDGAQVDVIQLQEMVSEKYGGRVVFAKAYYEVFNDLSLYQVIVEGFHEVFLTCCRVSTLVKDNTKVDFQSINHVTLLLDTSTMEEIKSIIIGYCKPITQFEQVATTTSAKAISFNVSSCCKHYTAYDLEKWNSMSQFNFVAMATNQNLKVFTQVHLSDQLKLPQTSSSTFRNNNDTYLSQEILLVGKAYQELIQQANYFHTFGGNENYVIAQNYFTVKVGIDFNNVTDLGGVYYSFQTKETLQLKQWDPGGCSFVHWDGLIVFGIP